MNPSATAPRLLADIGGTHARFALTSRPGSIESVRVYLCADHAGVEDTIRLYLRDTGITGIQHAAIAIANPVDGDQIRMTNHPWAFSIEATRRSLGFDTLLVVNDFTALAMALPALTGDHWVPIGGGAPRKDAPIGLLGPGTGLGVSGLVRGPDRWIALASEGGHMSFSPIDARDDAVLAYARRQWAHVSFERVAAGPALSLIHDALAEARGADLPRLSPSEITTLARHGDEAAINTLSCFSGILGTLAGNLALALGARGGVFLGGGVIEKCGAAFDAKLFRERFEQKGRFESLLTTIPTYRITAANPAFIGVANLLAEHLGPGH
ncbi:glucokinase [Paraburkholderia sp. J67]|uniref:glucokinase n=1 Tax=Paraburkholderia sp. J67 TaxID=2805435 RepID=UPI0039F540CF